MAAEPRALRPAVFLDRDGTLHAEPPHPLREPDELRLFDGVPRALASLQRAGFALVIVTNQSALARGELDHERLARVHAHLCEAVAPARIDGVFVCPHHGLEGLAPYRRECPCRKPRSGLLRDAERVLGLDLARSWIVGDALRDLEAGVSAGVRPVLVLTGKGVGERAKLVGSSAEHALVAKDFAAAAEVILRG